MFAEAEVRKTESRQKVAIAVEKILPRGNLTFEDDRVTLSSSNLETLRFMKDQFRDRRIRASARRQLLKNSTEIQTQLLLNKQAATVGIAALCDEAGESALGPIRLVIRADNINQAIDWLTEGYDDGGSASTS